MILLQQPNDKQLKRFLARQTEQEYTYLGIGATAADPPEQYVVDHTRALLGRGEATFVAAKEALLAWRQFQTGWLRTWPDGQPIQEGREVVIIARSLGVRWLNACRIVYVIPDDVAEGDATGATVVGDGGDGARDEQDSARGGEDSAGGRECAAARRQEAVRQFGFAYGTLPDHVGSGEERFLVEMDAEGRVWYDILAFSRPRHPLARLGYPFMRVVQKQFGRASAAAMRQAVRRLEPLAASVS